MVQMFIALLEHDAMRTKRFSHCESHCAWLRFDVRPEREAMCPASGTAVRVQLLDHYAVRVPGLANAEANCG